MSGTRTVCGMQMCVGNDVLLYQSSKNEKTDEEKKVCKELKQDIRKNRSKALKNPYVPLLYKVLMVFMGR